MKRPFWERIKVNLFFAFVALLVFAITAGIMAIISYFVFTSSLGDRLGQDSIPLIILVLAIWAVLMGTIVSALIGHFPLKPMQKLIRGLNRLAGGDFTVRLEDQGWPFEGIADSFNRMAGELGSMEMMRADFVNTFSHEFKTPIVSIKGFTEMLKYADLTDEERDEYMDIILSESERLATLSTSVLNLTRIEHQTILSERRVFNLAEQIRRCVLILESKWTSKQLEIAIDLEELHYRADEKLLKQVWLNLLDNAIKFSSEGGTVSVSLRRERDGVAFRVEDSGPGIRPEEQARIFDKFYQSDESRGTLGNGLGLSVAKRVAELHDGRVDCASTLGQGTVFTVYLPEEWIVEGES